MVEAVRPKTLMCPKCGAVNIGSDSYCYRCGEYLEDDFGKDPSPKNDVFGNPVKPKQERSISSADATKYALIIVVCFVIGFVGSSMIVDSLTSNDESDPGNTAVFIVEVYRGDSQASTYDIYFNGEFYETRTLHEKGTYQGYSLNLHSATSRVLNIRVESGGCSAEGTLTVYADRDVTLTLTLRSPSYTIT